MNKYSIWTFLLISITPVALELQLPPVTVTTPPSIITFNWTTSNCLGGDRALLNTGLWIYYNISFSTEGEPLQFFSYIQADYNSTSQTLDYQYEDLGPENVTEVLYDVIQLEHGGGECQCVRLGIVLFTHDIRLCTGAAYEPRKTNFKWRASLPTFISSGTEPVDDYHWPFPFECTNNSTRMHISFTIHDSRYFCNGTGLMPINDIEFSMRLLYNPTEWIPIAVLSFNNDDESRKVNRRGYITQVFKPSRDSHNRYSFKLCNLLGINSFQLRWIITSLIFNSSHDKWSLDDVEVIYELHNSQNYTIFRDNFDTSSLNLSNWTPSNIRNGYVMEECNESAPNFALAFGANVSEEYENEVITNAVLTNKICVSKYVNVNALAEDMLHDSDIVALDRILGEAVECELSDDLSDIEYYELLYQLQTDDYINYIILEVYILAYLLDTTSDEDYESSYFEVTCNIGNSIIQQSDSQESNAEQDLYSLIIGATLLQSMDQLLILLDEPISYSTNENLAVDIREFTNYDPYATFSTADFYGWSPPYISVTLPTEDLIALLEVYDNTIKTMISVYRNISHTLPDGKDDLSGAKLVSDVVGINLQCQQKICATQNISLPSPIQITFDHSSSLTASLQHNKSLATICAFLEIFESPTVLHYGQWSTYGCTKNQELSSTSKTVCKCAHLTHFGILLSARPVPVSDDHRLALNLIGYVGVSISIVAMAMTVTIFIAFKSLRNLRTYIHGNLCINLAIAQVIFVAGIDQATSGSVSIHCQVIAVLLHYFFLVSFMWMLMEGVYLYVTLFMIFEKKWKPYLISFTIISYGLPLIYMGFLTLPIGFGYFNTAQYGYHSACFLATNSHFIWAFIGPVILIFLANIGFYIMTAIVTYRHMNKQSRMKKLKKITWLKGMLSLTVVMGLTWIIGLAAVKEENLTFLVYIYTIFIAFQGTLIFVIFIIFAKSVQDSFKACWTTKIKHSNRMTRQISMRINPSKMKTTEDMFLKDDTAKTTEL